MTNIRDSLIYGKNYLKKNNIESYQLDAEILLMKAIEKDKTFLYAYPEYELEERERKKYLKSLRKRANRFPVAYITGEKEFYGNKFLVQKGVFCPRPETELLIEEAKKIFDINSKIRVYEIGCGTGIISITLLMIFPKSVVYCSDVNEKAIEITKRNAELHKVQDRIKILKGDFFEPVKYQEFDLVVSNPPYLSLEDYYNAEPEVRKEPKRALMSKEKGLGAIKKIIRESKKYLVKNGYLLLEIGNTQGDYVREYARKFGYSVDIIKDLNDFDRVVKAKLIKF
ncbi:MAG: peptide chain release factor N(5)-glutamine methyltransferase [Proteobacteria bacterium]|nr:peptide chain release factor N(5)-glutamine methyltransferase [Pseudomonadota bacterium]